MDIKEAINQQQIDEWKSIYGKIFKTTIGDDTIIWRKLKRKEYVNIMSNEEMNAIEGSKAYARQDLMTMTATLFPENIGELIEDNAGISATMADEIMLKSGFDITVTEEL